MSSEMTRFGLSSLTLADAPGNCRLHSRSATLLVRGFALLFAYGCVMPLRHVPNLGHAGDWRGLAKCAFVVLVQLALARFLWSRPRQVFATPRGLEVVTGKQRRLVPWSRVLDVRELRYARFLAPWNPRQWQVDLDRDERFDFWGTRKARQIVIEYVARAEGRAA